jgi:hypothetical protein
VADPHAGRCPAGWRQPFKKIYSPGARISFAFGDGTCRAFLMLTGDLFCLKKKMNIIHHREFILRGYESGVDRPDAECHISWIRWTGPVDASNLILKTSKKF